MFASLKLGQKGILLMSLVLILEGLYFGVNFYLLDQAEHESKRQEVTKEIQNKTSKLILLMYTAGDKVGKYALNKDEVTGPRFLKEYIAARNGVTETMEWLKTAVKANQPQQYALLEKIEGNVKIGLGIVESMREAADTESRLEAVRFGLKQRVTMQPCIEELVHDQMNFMNQEKEIELKAPEIQAAKLHQQQLLLLGGAGVDCVMILVLLAFCRGIAKRLAIVSDNSERLKNGEPLHAPLSGGDQIDMLDNSFHTMVASLRGEEALLRSSENSVLSLISQMPAGLLIIDRFGGIEFANPKFAGALGYDQDELAALGLADVFSSRTKIDTDLFTWLKERSEGHVVEVSAKRKNGDTIHVEFSITDVSYDDDQHYIAMALDVSERHEMEKLRQAFVAMVSHELRTPLASVSMFLELLEMGVFGDSNSSISKDLNFASRQTEEVIMLINDLLDLEKLEANKLELVKSNCEIEDLIDSAVETMANAVESADVLLHFEGSEVSALVDPERITQALTKMLSSVIRLTPPSDTIKIDAIATEENAVEIFFNVATLSIPEEQVESIFERFQQISLPTLRDGAGLGLGLALSRAIIQQHGGSVGVISKDRGGTTFWIHIPR